MIPAGFSTSRFGPVLPVMAAALLALQSLTRRIQTLRRLALLLLIAGLSVPSMAQAQAPVARPGAGADSPEPPPPRYSTPYDGAVQLVKEGRPDQALIQIDRALKDDARNPQLRFLKGVLLAQSEKSAEAEAIFTALIEDFPELPEPYNNLAVLRASANDWEGARQILTRAVAALPTYALAHDNLGEVLLRLAEQAFARAAQHAAPGDPSARKLSLTRDLIERISTSASSAPPHGANPAPRPGAASNPRQSPAAGQGTDANPKSRVP